MRIARFFSQKSGLEVRVGRRFQERNDRTYESGCVVLRAFPLEKGKKDAQRTMLLSGAEAFRLARTIERTLSKVAESSVDVLVHSFGEGKDKTTTVLRITLQKGKDGKKWYFGVTISRSKEDRITVWMDPGDGLYFAHLLKAFSVESAYETEVETTEKESEPDAPKTGNGNAPEEVSQESPGSVSESPDTPGEDDQAHDTPPW